jgi:transporter family-2 protein
MEGALFAILAGVFISLQSVFNTRVSDKIGLFETTTVVHTVGLVFALALMLLFGSGSFKKINEVNKLYLFGGAFGVIIIFAVIKGISLLGTAYAVSIMLVTQLIVSTLIDTFGWFGTVRIKMDFTKPLGILIMIIGIIIFKIKG